MNSTALPDEIQQFKVSPGQRSECTRLVLQIERDAVALAQLSALTKEARAVLANRREELRAVKASARSLPHPAFSRGVTGY